MPLILKTQTAEKDVDEIWNYLYSKSPQGAEKIIHQIEQKLFMLAKNPLSGRSRNDLAIDLRSTPVGHYVIFYKPIKEGILVIRTLHGSRDIESFFP